MDKKIVTQILLTQLQLNLSPCFYINTLKMCTTFFSNEDLEYIKTKLLQQVEKSVHELTTEIQNITVQEKEEKKRSQQSILLKTKMHHEKTSLSVSIKPKAKIFANNSNGLAGLTNKQINNLEFFSKASKSKAPQKPIETKTGIARKMIKRAINDFPSLKKQHKNPKISPIKGIIKPPPKKRLSSK